MQLNLKWKQSKAKQVVCKQTYAFAYKQINLTKLPNKAAVKMMIKIQISFNSLIHIDAVASEKKE